METLQKTSTCHGQAAMQHPLVSVVMPAYNAEKYIGEAIRSVQSQTYTNWVLLVIDDCSTDHTVDVEFGFFGTLAIWGQLKPEIEVWNYPKANGSHC